MNDYETLKAALADAPEVRPPSPPRLASRITLALTVAVLVAPMLGLWGCASVLRSKPAPVWVCGTFNGHSISFDLSEPFHLENDPAKSPKVAIDFHLCAPGEREALRGHSAAAKPERAAAAPAQYSCRSATCSVDCLPGFVARCDYDDRCFCQPEGVDRVGVLSEDGGR